MPFKSEKQRRWMWANEPEMAEKWEDEEEKNEGRRLKITKRQLRRIIRESTYGSYAKQGPGSYSDVIVMSPTGDSVLVGGMEVAPSSIAYELEVASGQRVPTDIARDLESELMRQMSSGYVEIPISFENGHWRLE